MTPTSRENKTSQAEGVPENSLSEPLDGLSIELGRISAEIQSINSGFQAQMQQVLSDVRIAIENEYRARFDKSMQDLREQIRTQIREELEKEFQEELEKRIARLGDVHKEIELVSGKLEGIAKEIAAMLDDPSIELSKVMRKRTEQAEMKAYLDGLRFSIAEQAKGQASGK